MMKVVGYRDLRPVNWFTGKREPLEAGAGHICDRCGAEHAIVYEVEDDTTGKVYAVGSGCAKQQFGFDPDKSEEAKRFIKSVRQQIAFDIHTKRHEVIAKLAQEIAAGVSSLKVPPISSEKVVNKYTGKEELMWRCGDNDFRQLLDVDNNSARGMVVSGWLRNRVNEQVPTEWRGVVIGSKPNNPKSYPESMGNLCTRLAMKVLYDTGRAIFY
jgi:hypothetical protein